MQLKKYSVLLIIFVFIAGCGKNNHKNSYTGVLEGTSINIPALTGGVIIELMVNTGDEVKKGQPLAVIDSTELILQKEQLLATFAELDVQTKIANTGLANVEKNLSYIEERQKRVEQLYNNKSVPKQNLDDINNQLQNARSAFETALGKLQGIAAHREQLSVQLKIINKKINDAVVIAPRDGIVVTKYFEAGEAVPPYTPLIEIIDISKMTTKIYISEKQLALVKHGQKVSVNIDGLDKQLTGKVSWISPKAEFTPKNILTPETRTSLVYAVKISVNNKDGVLKHGMPVVIELQD
ncbi:efflux RND transporter periplasmic adaptor subunit [candidate division KSB1 bacterium]|nr:efflux RND transporter periplasmic adaptor subunit [candidate division KSB1 bacterium]